MVGVVAASGYPSRENPGHFAFLAELVDAWRDQGVETTVIAPQPNALLRFVGREGKLPDEPGVRRPERWGFGGISPRLGGLPGRLTVAASANAIVAEAMRLPAPDFAYGHFLYPAGLAVARMGVPAFVALGESDLTKYESCFPRETIARDLARFTGIVAVSEPIRELIVERYGVPTTQVRVFPNAVNTARFHPRDKAEMRTRYGLPQDEVLVAFVGHFIERKGPLRVLEAIQGLPVKAVFIGQGPQHPSGPQVLRAAPAERDEVAELLAACDLFVLPTLAEGSCNAVLEALASGLPVVSSNRPFNRPVLDETNSILVEPTDVSQIRAAVSGLLAPELRSRLSEGARETAMALTIEARAMAIRNFIGDRI